MYQSVCLPHTYVDVSVCLSHTYWCISLSVFHTRCISMSVSLTSHILMYQSLSLTHTHDISTLPLNTHSHMDVSTTPMCTSQPADRQTATNSHRHGCIHLSYVQPADRLLTNCHWSLTWQTFSTRWPNSSWKVKVSRFLNTACKVDPDGPRPRVPTQTWVRKQTFYDYMLEVRQKADIGYRLEVRGDFHNITLVVRASIQDNGIQYSYTASTELVTFTNCKI